MYKILKLNYSSYEIDVVLVEKEECEIKSKNIIREPAIIIKLKNQETKPIILSKQGAKVLAHRVKRNTEVPEYEEVGEKKIIFDNIDYPGWFHSDVEKMAELIECIDIDDIGGRFTLIDFMDDSYYLESKALLHPKIETSNPNCLFSKNGECCRKMIIVDYSAAVCMNHLDSEMELNDIIKESKGNCSIYECGSQSHNKITGDNRWSEICGDCKQSIGYEIGLLRDNYDSINMKVTSKII